MDALLDRIDLVLTAGQMYAAATRAAIAGISNDSATISLGVRTVALYLVLISPDYAVRY